MAQGSTRTAGRRVRAPRLSATDRREQILAAAAQFFADHGFAGTTRALAETLGIRQALLYRYFPSKDALVDAVFQRVFLQRWTEDLAGLLGDRRRPLEDRLADAYLAYVAQDDGLAIRLLMRAALDAMPLPARRGAMLTQQIFEPLIGELRHEARLPGLDRLAMTREERELVTMLHGAVLFRGIREHIYRQPIAAEAAATLALYARTFLAGARATLRALHGRPALRDRLADPPAPTPTRPMRRLGTRS